MERKNPHHRHAGSAVMTCFIQALSAVLFIGAILFDPTRAVSQDTQEEPSQADIDLKKGYSLFAGTMADMTWQEIEQAMNSNAVVLLPLGVIEEHGPHIACGADMYQGYLQCLLVKSELDKIGVPAVIAPPFYWGVNHSTRNFPGSFDIKPETMKALINDILQNLQCWGFKEVYAINLHGEWGHNQAILECAKEARQSLGIDMRWVASERMAQRYGLKGDEEYVVFVAFEPLDGGPQVDVPDFHAGAQETGDMIGFFPALVNLELAKTLTAPDMKPEGYREWGQDARLVTPLGYAGNPSAHDAEWSRKAFKADCLSIAEAITESHRKGGK